MNTKRMIAAMLTAATVSCLAGTVSADAAYKFEGFTDEQIAASSVKPYMTVSSEVITPEEAAANPTRTVTISVNSDGVDGGYYSSVGMHIYFDNSLEIVRKRSGAPDVTLGDACSLLYSSVREDQTKTPVLNGLFVSLASTFNNGTNGDMFSFGVTLPDKVSAGDVFPIDIVYSSGELAKDVFLATGASYSDLMNAFAFTQGIYNKEYNPSFKASAEDMKKCPSLKLVPSDADGYIAIAGGAEPVYGDADGNGELSVSDVVSVLQYTVNHTKYPLSKTAMILSDVNVDNTIDVNDAFLIQQADAKLITLPTKSE